MNKPPVLSTSEIVERIRNGTAKNIAEAQRNADVEWYEAKFTLKSKRSEKND